MKNRALFPVVVVLIAGGLAFYLWYNGQKPAAAEGSSRLIVAKMDIERLTKVDPLAQFDVVDWPTNLLPVGAMIEKKERSNPNEPEKTVYRTVVGNEEVPKISERSFVSAAYKSMPITVGMLSDPGQAITATQLKPGMVAVSVNTEEASSVSGLVKPGSRVNVLVTLRIPKVGSNDTQDVCVSALRDVEVFAVGGVIQPKGVKEGDKPVVARTITLQLTPEQSKILTLLADRGKITMELVSAKPGEPPEPLKDVPMSLTDALEKAGYKEGKSKEPEVKDVRLIEGILKAIANVSPAQAAAQPTPGAKGLEVVALPAPTPKPVEVTIYGPGHAVYEKVTFSSYDATEPTQEYRKNAPSYMPVPSLPPAAPIGGNPPPIAPDVPPVQ